DDIIDILNSICPSLQTVFFELVASILINMKRLLTVCLVALLISSGSFAQTLSRKQGWGLDLESVAWLDAQEGISVGERLIIRTNDGGATWEEVVQKFEVRFLDVAYLEEGRAVA